MKRYVSVNALFEESGNIIPKTLTWDENHCYPISKIIDIRTKKISGKTTEIQFTCVILGQIKFLYYDEKRWYVLLTNKSAM